MKLQIISILCICEFFTWQHIVQSQESGKTNGDEPLDNRMREQDRSHPALSDRPDSANRAAFLKHSLDDIKTLRDEAIKAIEYYAIDLEQVGRSYAWNTKAIQRLFSQEIAFSGKTTTVLKQPDKYSAIAVFGALDLTYQGWKQLTDTEHAEIKERAKLLSRHEDPSVRAAAIRLHFRFSSSPQAADVFAAALQDLEHAKGSSNANAVHGIMGLKAGKHYNEKSYVIVKGLMDHKDPSIRRAACANLTSLAPTDELIDDATRYCLLLIKQGKGDVPQLIGSLQFAKQNGRASIASAALLIDLLADRTQPTSWRIAAASSLKSVAHSPELEDRATAAILIAQDQQVELVSLDLLSGWGVLSDQNRGKLSQWSVNQPRPVRLTAESLVKNAKERK